MIHNPKQTSMIFRPAFTALALMATVGLSHAGVIPDYDTFGNLAGATFGGSGIPTNPTAITNENGFTLGLTAFGRYQNPQLTNNGAGTFYATPGINDGLGPVSQTPGATWGFGYYINGGTAQQLGSYQIDLFYDLDPAAGTELADMGRIDIDAFLNFYSAGALTLVQDAQNLHSSFFSVGNAFTTSPAMDFDANLPGEYALMLRVRDANGADLATSSILVQVVPEPGTLALLGVALFGLAATRRRRS